MGVRSTERSSTIAGPREPVLPLYISETFSPLSHRRKSKCVNKLASRNPGCVGALTSGGNNRPRLFRARLCSARRIHHYIPGQGRANEMWLGNARQRSRRAREPRRLRAGSVVERSLGRMSMNIPIVNGIDDFSAITGAARANRCVSK